MHRNHVHCLAALSPDALQGLVVSNPHVLTARTTTISVTIFNIGNFLFSHLDTGML